MKQLTASHATLHCFLFYSPLFPLLLTLPVSPNQHLIPSSGSVFRKTAKTAGSTSNSCKQILKIYFEVIIPTYIRSIETFLLVISGMLIILLHSSTLASLRFNWVESKTLGHSLGVAFTQFGNNNCIVLGNLSA